MGFSSWMTTFLPQAQQVMAWLRNMFQTFVTNIIMQNNILYLVVLLTAVGAVAPFVYSVLASIRFSRATSMPEMNFTGKNSLTGVLLHNYKKKLKDRQRAEDRFYNGNPYTVWINGTPYFASDNQDYRQKRWDEEQEKFLNRQKRKAKASNAMYGNVDEWEYALDSKEKERIAAISRVVENNMLGLKSSRSDRKLYNKYMKTEHEPVTGPVDMGGGERHPYGLYRPELIHSAGHEGDGYYWQGEKVASIDIEKDED